MRSACRTDARRDRLEWTLNFRAAGSCRVSAYHEAGRVNIKITDDGKGVDVERISQKVIEKGLKSEAELEQMSHQDLLHLVFLPGFSTMDQADDVSGRGVGMDVVKTSIQKLGGSFDFESAAGVGTTILLRLPLTLAIIPSLIVASGDYLYAIPQVSLVELVSLYDEEILSKIERADDQEIYRLRGRLLPIVRLSEILARPQLFTREVRSEIAENQYQKNQELFKSNGQSKSNIEFTDSLNFVVLKVGNNHYGLIIDEIVGTEEIVVKPLHPAIKSLGIYSGATIMGNGKTALILDVGGISRHAGITLAERIMDERDKEFSSEEMQSVLLFKSGVKEQLALSLPLIRRIEPFLMKDIEVIGDKEYLTVDGVSTQIVRLDKILNISPVVEQEKMYLILPRHLKRPIGILMSGFIDVVDTKIDLDVTSYQAEGLLGTSIINNVMTLFIDIYRMFETFAPNSSTSLDPAILGHEDETDDKIKRILLLEDVSFFRQLIKGYLEEQGYLVTAVKNGKLGLDEIEENNFDLIVSDIEMPVMNGWDFMGNVRNTLKMKDIPAIALTSLDSKEAKEKAIENGFNYYEVKLDRERFLKTVTSAVEAEK